MEIEDSEKPAPGAELPPAKPPGTAFWASGAGILLALPPIVGYAILAMVLFGEVDSAVLNSGAAMCTALVVAALLILVPPLLYILGANEYNEYMATLRRAAKELGE